MTTQTDRVAMELRRRILAGELAPGERILELQFAPELGASRTPLRLALAELERQGLVERVGKRGFQVRRITLDEVAQAIDVRGVLEGLAARLLAEAGATDPVRLALTACVGEGRALLAANGGGGSAQDKARWAEMNARFHALLAEAPGNGALRNALEQIGKTPLAAPGALGFSGLQLTLEWSFLHRAQTDHEDVLRAILAREGARAEALMREHARRSSDNKRLLAQRQAG